METKTEDRRVLKTKRQLRQGLAVLMQEKNINRITVRELTDLVDINRATFYTHYKDIYDLVEQIENELIDDFVTGMQRHMLSPDKPDLVPVLTEVFRHVEANADICRALMGKNGDIAYVRRIRDFVREYFRQNWQIYFPNDTSQTWGYPFVFVLSGCLGLLEQWLEGGMAEPVAVIAELEANLILNGLREYPRQASGKQ